MLRQTSPTGSRAPRATPGTVSLLAMITSVFGLGGCQVVKGIFEAGFGVGVVVVIAVVAVAGGVLALVSRK